MSATPGFAATPRLARTAHATTAATTDKSGATTANIVDALTGVAAGTKIEGITIMCDGDPADSTLLVFIHNGTDYKLWDDIDLGNPAASSTTVAGNRFEKRYDSLYLPSTSFKIATGLTVVTVSGNVVTWVHGADF